MGFAAKRGLLAVLLAFGAVGFVPSGASATSIFGLDKAGYMSGSTMDGSPPWLQVSVSRVSNTRLELDFQTKMSGAGEFVSEVYLNVDPKLNLSKLSASYKPNSGAQASVTVAGKDDGISFPGSHSTFDLEFAFPTANSGRLGNGAGNFTTSTYYLDYSPGGLTDGSLSFESTPDKNQTDKYYLGAHIQGMPGGGSAKYGETAAPLSANPEPASAVLAGGLLLVGAVGGGVGWRRRRAAR
jgi:hypothetical protein